MIQTKTNTRIAVVGPDGPAWLTIAQLLALPDTAPAEVTPVPTVPVAPAPVIVAEPVKPVVPVIADQSGRVGEDFTFTIPKELFPGATSIDINDLAPGLRYNGTTLTIWGKPTQPDTRTQTVSASGPGVALVQVRFQLRFWADPVAITSQPVSQPTTDPGDPSDETNPIYLTLSSQS